jgi:hypothetical protein
MDEKVYEFFIFIIIAIFLECGMGILYGVGVGYNPILVFFASVSINFLTILVIAAIIGLLLKWRKRYGILD